MLIITNIIYKIKNNVTGFAVGISPKKKSTAPLDFLKELEN